jgi:Tat protein secretion system quality control protein TatD with DNase activity
MLIDAHTHLNLEDLFIHRKQYLTDFQHAGGKILVNAGAHTDYNINGLLIAQAAQPLFPDLMVKATLGFHPRDSRQYQEEHFSLLIAELEEQYLQHSSAVIAIGECGIDLHGEGNSPVKVQQTLFRFHAQLAKKL